MSRFNSSVGHHLVASPSGMAASLQEDKMGVQLPPRPPLSGYSLIGKALGSGPRECWFKSSYPDQIKPEIRVRGPHVPLQGTDSSIGRTPATCARGSIAECYLAKVETPERNRSRAPICRCGETSRPSGIRGRRSKDRAGASPAAGTNSPSSFNGKDWSFLNSR